MEQEIEVKTEELDEEPPYNLATMNEEFPIKEESTYRYVNSSSPVHQNYEVKKESIEGGIFMQETSNSGCAMIETLTIKKEPQDIVISSYMSLANDQTGEHSQDFQTFKTETEDCKDNNYSMISDTSSDMVIDDRNSAASFLGSKDSRDDTNMCFIVKAETGEVVEVIDMDKKSTSQSASIDKGEKTFKCDDCKFSCRFRNVFVRHKQIHSGEKSFKCGECDYSSSQKSHLKEHKMRSHSQAKPMQAGRKRFKCDECDCCCASISKLLLHKRIHSGEKPFKCDECDYACAGKHTLKRHTLIHSGAKPFKCDQCDYACTLKSDLKTHILKHSGEKPFKCDQCDFASAYKTSLTTHVLKHTGAKPFKCNQCDYACGCKGDLKQHMIKHTRAKPFKCGHCDYAYVHKGDLMKHILTHHGTKQFKCD